MSVIDNWFRKKYMIMAQAQLNQQQVSNSKAQTGSRSLAFSSRNEISINIRPAVGGQVIEYSRFDEATDTRHQATHIIVEGEDFGTRLSQIITFEALKQ